MAKKAGKLTLFVDTNILVYANLANSPFHADARNKLNYYFQNGYDIWISRQIIREYLVVMSRALDAQGKYDAVQLVKDTRKLVAQFFVADESDATTNELFQLIEKYGILGKSVYDCNIIATIKIFTLKNLLTHNRADFQWYNEGILVIPLI